GGRPRSACARTGTAPANANCSSARSVSSRLILINRCTAPTSRSRTGTQEGIVRDQQTGGRPSSSPAPESSDPFAAEIGTRPAANSPVTAPSVSLPKGGGAIRSIGEKFTVNAVTGTVALTVPLPLSPARSGFMPDLSLSYDSGSGNGPFGLGWRLS